MQLPDPEICRALARAVTEARKWRWYAGMLTTEYGRVLNARVTDMWTGKTESILGTVAHMENPEDIPPLPPDALPDLTDLLTAAGALPVARKVWGDSSLYVVRRWRHGTPDYRWYVERPNCGRTMVLQPDGWWGVDPTDTLFADFATELEALIAAILAAPEPV